MFSSLGHSSARSSQGDQDFFNKSPTQESEKRDTAKDESEVPKKEEHKLTADEVVEMEREKMRARRKKIFEEESLLFDNEEEERKAAVRGLSDGQEGGLPLQVWYTNNEYSLRRSPKLLKR